MSQSDQSLGVPDPLPETHCSFYCTVAQIEPNKNDEPLSTVAVVPTVDELKAKESSEGLALEGVVRAPLQSRA